MIRNRKKMTFVSKSQTYFPAKTSTMSSLHRSRMEIVYIYISRCEKRQILKLKIGFWNSTSMGLMCSFVLYMFVAGVILYPVQLVCTFILGLQDCQHCAVRTISSIIYKCKDTQ